MSLQSPAVTVGAIVAAMAAVAFLEMLIPLRARDDGHRAHLAPNLSLTLITFATNVLFNAALITMLLRREAGGHGLLARLALPSALATVLVVLLLDFSFYVAHVAMHKIPGFWRFHRVHHSDAAVDVTTTIRQHPGEGVIRYAFLAAFAIPLGASPEVFAVYRLVSAISGLLEHANICLPRGFDDRLSLLFTWADFHKVHHARDAHWADSNYGNLVSLWDRLFATFTPARHGRAVVYGLDGYDDPAMQTTLGLLTMPSLRAEPDRGEFA